MSNLRHIAVCGAIFAALSLSAAYTFWHGRPTGPAALVVTPRQYVPLLPGATANFTARMYHNNGADNVEKMNLGKKGAERKDNAQYASDQPGLRSDCQG